MNEIFLAEGEGGGWYAPSSYDIYIGSESLGHQEYFEDTVRHEVGHAVHEQHRTLVNSWLKSRFGWQVFGTSNNDIDSWIMQLGGWGRANLREQAQIRTYLVECLGPGGRWTSGGPAFVPSNHPWRDANFAPRLAHEKTGDYWYENLMNWHRHDGKAFFLNYYYRTLNIINEETLELVLKMPSTYAAMSHFEFFAELYALYYDLDDADWKNIPSDVKEWMRNNIGEGGKVSPMMFASQPVEERKEFEWIDRPTSA